MLHNTVAGLCCCASSPSTSSALLSESSFSCPFRSQHLSDTALHAQLAKVLLLPFEPVFLLRLCECNFVVLGDDMSVYIYI